MEAYKASFSSIWKMLFDYQRLLVWLPIFIFLTNTTGEYISGSSQIDIHLLSFQLPRSQSLDNESSTSYSINPCCSNHREEQTDTSDLTCSSHCRVRLGLCLSQQGTAPSPSNSKNFINPSGSLKEEDDDDDVELPPTAVEQWKRLQYKVVETSKVFPLRCTKPSDDYVRTLAFRFSNGQVAWNHSEHNYRIRLQTMPLDGLTMTLTIYRVTGGKNLRVLDRLHRHITPSERNNAWSIVNLAPANRNFPKSAISNNTSLTTESPLKPTANISIQRPSYEVLIQYRYTCRRHYYGQRCSHYCQPRDSPLGHYKCHPNTGELICISGWGGTRCNIALCKRGCIHGLCEEPDVCKCTDGWKGSRCDQCVPTPGCEHGTCQINNRLAESEPYTCACFPGWGGMLCNINTKFCEFSNQICQNGGHCVNTQDLSGTKPLYKCLCSPGFKGTHCEMIMDDCRYHGCSEHGKCQSTGQCSCLLGFYGSRCQFNQSLCAQRPCIGAQSQCMDVPFNGNPMTLRNSTEVPTSFRCDCEPGRFGINCERIQDECQQEQPCFNGGQCVNLQPNGFQCICPPQFKGAHCELTQTACHELSCVNGGECVDGLTQFTCHCPFGWTGTTCRENVNECAEVPRTTGRALCQNGAGCRDLLGSYLCLCPSGWSGKHCEHRTTECDPPTNCSLNSKGDDNLTTLNVQPLEPKPQEQNQAKQYTAILCIAIGIAIPLTAFAVLGTALVLISHSRAVRKHHAPECSIMQVTDSYTKHNPLNESDIDYMRMLGAIQRIDQREAGHMKHADPDSLRFAKSEKSILCLASNSTINSGKLVDVEKDDTRNMSAQCTPSLHLNKNFLTLHSNTEAHPLSSYDFVNASVAPELLPSSLSNMRRYQTTSSPNYEQQQTQRQSERISLQSNRSDTPPPAYDELTLISADHVII